MIIQYIYISYIYLINENPAWFLTPRHTKKLWTAKKQTWWDAPVCKLANKCSRTFWIQGKLSWWIEARLYKFNVDKKDSLLLSLPHCNQNSIVTSDWVRGTYLLLEHHSKVKYTNVLKYTQTGLNIPSAWSHQSIHLNKTKPETELCKWQLPLH